ncbi:DUF3592 domain-containing protein [Microbulbifer sp. M83]|uniref:DUF3592 domain-containing protein n=1 Tax=Microbulbifer sp. M83 TaxID=3118246 RepID=UPI002FE1DC71
MTTLSEINLVNLSGLFVAVSAITYLVIARARRAWPKVRGRVEQSKLDAEIHEGPGISASEYQVTIGKSRSISYTPVLRYRYQVRGREYIGCKLFSVNLLPIRPQDLLPVVAGSTVDVFFNPANPARAYLLPSGLVLPVIYLLIGTTLALLDAGQLEAVRAIAADLWHAFTRLGKP